MDIHLDFELGDHALFGIVCRIPTVQQATGQVRFVVLFKLVLVMQKAKEDNCLFERDLDLVVRFLGTSVPSYTGRPVRQATYGFGSLFEVLVDIQG